MKAPILFNRHDRLSHAQALYWKDLLYRIVRIGTELEFALPKGQRKADFLPPLQETLKPSRDLNRLGKHGVLDIISEHCGIEIQIIGRQPYYTALIEQFQNIYTLLPDGIRARPTCGLHYHALAPGLREPIPEIVLANTWNLTRRYAPYLKFMTSAGDKLSSLTRRRNYNSHLEMVRLDAGKLNMQEIQQRLHDSYIVPEHQNFLNLEHLKFDEQGNIIDFHLEFRFPDADLSPTSVVAKTFLFLAIVIKAVDMSQYGVIHVGKIKEWRRKVELLGILNNNDGKLATSDTSKITPDIIEELRVGGRELLEQLKPVLDRLEGNPSFEVLSLLVETPISLLRNSGRSWETIEALLDERAKTELDELDSVDKRIMKSIEFAEFSGYEVLETWKWEVARDLFLTPQELDQRLEKLDHLRGIRWDVRLGTITFAR